MVDGPPPPAGDPLPAWLEQTLAACMTADVAALRAGLAVTGRMPNAVEQLPRRLRELITASQAKVAARRARLPVPSFAEELPVTHRRHEIAAAIAANPVVIVCGETGSGKTTQLPKILLGMGHGARGLIGHTQPRRIAARATAARIAKELASDLGDLVGYKIRFSDHAGPDTAIRLMTDGILLAETQGDRSLARYDSIIIDEAHERSLNIDFLLGYLKSLLPSRPELRVIVTSATLDAERFARHFARGEVAAPIIEVSGRLHPIELRWRPLATLDRQAERDVNESIVDAADELAQHGPGDVLVFLPGEREIREAAEALRKHHFGPAAMRGATTEILPLYARQSAAEQARVFTPAKGRRIVLATNVAETSLTVPGVRYVIDTGLARIKRYSARNKVEQLRVEAISQAAANQRAGRCGRVAAGICVRLYDEDDHARRAAHTDPEILRASLAGVILRMTSLELGAVEAFPFIDRPSPRLISDGYQLLGELGAVDEARALTPVGRELAKLPVDPRIGRMVLAARDRGALAEVLVIASALAVQDPRERPRESAGSADAAHAKWKHDRSEFLAWLALWRAFDSVWKQDSQRKQRDWCRTNFLSYLRMREWRDVHAQLLTLSAEHGWRENEIPADYVAIHKSLLAGLLGNVGLKNEEEGHYLGAHGTKFLPHPSSALGKRAGRWVMAAEIVETSRVFARCIARIEPEWLEEVGGHLLRRHRYEPHWSKRRGEVMAYESATLHGIQLYVRRAVPYARLDPLRAREIFIREALVQGELPEDVVRRADFFRLNRALVAEIEALEHRSRRPDVLVDDSLIEAFYDQRLPQEVLGVASFEAWRVAAERENPRILHLDRTELMRHDASGITTERFPTTMMVHGQALSMSYAFSPGAGDDGVTLTVPLAMLNHVPQARMQWLVPGMLEAKVKQLLRGLPPKAKHRLGNLDAFSAQFCAAAHNHETPLAGALLREIEARTQLVLPSGSLREENLPAHLSMNIRVIDEHGRMLAQSRNLAEIKAALAHAVEAHFASADSAASEHERLTDWSFGPLPDIMEVCVAGRAVIGYPALVESGDAVALRVFDTAERAELEHRLGLRRLFALRLAEQVRHVERQLPGLRELAMRFLGFGTDAELRAQIVAATLERSCMQAPLPRDAQQFAARREEARARIVLLAQEIVRLVGVILDEHAMVQRKLGGLKIWPAAAEDIRGQLGALLTKDFVATLAYDRLSQLPRYLKAAGMRIDKLRADPARDDRLLREFQAVARPYERECAALARTGVHDPALYDFRWLLEELRVALFAQELKTPVQVSVKRLQKIWGARHHGVR